ncbi:hypothetical protein QE410_001203 [Microbacterium sp. SORGH_AS 1204]|uniref:hypothetical protein n=1 Tax=Microbacterium sp. SORGH_AS_1204 TaxID=3041785 RepID=UPI002791B9E3|nr:hypothetical protein [Microbacterium sp. SORGH_AS_1204]MDQ1136404.1 hypothetical protein [Microbacterium sp. SORGH_AS_1204]
MRRLLVTATAVFAATALLAGCAGVPAADTAAVTETTPRVGPPPATQEPYLGSEPSPTAPATPDPAAAVAQAAAWLDAIVLPEGAARVDGGAVGFSSHTGWICSPIAEEGAVWRIPGASVAQTVNWIRENPPADLVSTAYGLLSDDPVVSSAATGFTPADRSQQGVVLTVEKNGDGVAVRAEVAALSAGSVCQPPPAGSTWGLPGQG